MCAIPTMTVVEPTDISMLKPYASDGRTIRHVLHEIGRSYCVDVYREDSTLRSVRATF